MKKLLVFLVLSLVSIGIFASDFVVDEMFTPEKPKLGGTLTIRLSSAPQSFNYYGTLDNAAYTIAAQFLRGLVDLNPITFVIEPALAESWEVSEDGKEVLFHLRDVKWSDGVPFTADDVIFSMDYFIMNRFAEGNEIARFTIGGELVRWEKVDDKTVKAYLPEPYGAFFNVLSHAYIYPKHKLESKIDKNDLGSVNRLWLTNTPPSEIVGTGPFVLKEYVTEQKVVLEKNPYYWKADKWGTKLPYVDELVYLVIQDDEVATAQFLAGQIDYISVSPKDYPYLKQEELSKGKIMVFKGEPVKPTPSPVHITFNFDTKDPELKEIFRNERFRWAMEYALDRNRIIEEVYNTLAVYGGTPVLPSNKAFYNPNIEGIRRSYDLKMAEQMLDSIGIKDRNNDGWRELPSGERFEFVLTSSSAQENQDIAYIFSQDLEKIGVKVHLQILDPTLVSQSTLSGDYEAAIGAFGNQPDPQLRKAIWQPGNHLYYNHLSTMNKETSEPIFEEMLEWELRIFEDFEKAQITMDQKLRKIYYDDWQALYAYYVPFIYVCKGMELSAKQSDLSNYFVNDEGVIVYLNETLFKK